MFEGHPVGCAVRGLWRGLVREALVVRDERAGMEPRGEFERSIPFLVWCALHGWSEAWSVFPLRRLSQSCILKLFRALGETVRQTAARRHEHLDRLSHRSSL